MSGLEDQSYASNLPRSELSSGDVDMENRTYFTIPPHSNQESHTDSTKISLSVDLICEGTSKPRDQLVEDNLANTVAGESTALPDTAQSRKRRRSEDSRDFADPPDRSISGFDFDQNPYQHCSRFDQKCMRTVLKKRTASVLKKYFLVDNSETRNTVDYIRTIVRNSSDLQEIMRTDDAQHEWRGLRFLKAFYECPDMKEVHGLVSFLIVHFTDSSLEKWKEPEIAGIENYMRFQGRNTRSLKRNKARYPSSDLEDFYKVITEGLYKHIEKEPKSSPAKTDTPKHDRHAMHLRSSAKLQSTPLDCQAPEAMDVYESLKREADGLLAD